MSSLLGAFDFSASVKGIYVRSSSYLDFEENFVVAAITKVTYEANAAKARSWPEFSNVQSSRAVLATSSSPGLLWSISEKMRPWERDWFLQKFQCRHDIILKWQNRLNLTYCIQFNWNRGIWNIFARLMETHQRNTVNDLINPRGVYLILGVQEGAFNRWEAFKRERRLFS